MYGDSSPASLEPFIQKLDTASKQGRPADRAELVRLVVLLFTAVRTCQEAYLRNKKQDTEESNKSFGASIITLGSVIDSLEATLHIFAPNVFAGVTEYFQSEVAVAGEYESNDEALEFLHRFKDSYRWSSLRSMEGLEDSHKGDFDVLIEQLGRFIRENFSMEEVFQASST